MWGRRTGAGAAPQSAEQIVERRMHGHDPHAGHDTGGLPWAGRELSANPFADDDGRADPALAVALAGGDEAAVVTALAGARLLVAVVAVPTQVEQARATGLQGDSFSEMATVVLTAPDGERALPAFSGTEAVAAWDPSARPVPVTAEDAARAALEEGCTVMVVDLEGPHRRVVRASQLWALAQERPWQHPAQDPVVRAALDEVVLADPHVRAVELEAPAPGRLVVRLVLEPGLTGHAVEESSRRAAAALAVDDVRIRLDEVGIAIRPA